MTRYLLSVYQPSTGERPPPEVLARIDADLADVHADLLAAGSWVFAGGLAGPSTATVVRAGDDEVLLTDGPFLEGKEHLGGLAIVEAEDLDEALVWARRFAEATTLPVEVQPFL
jgi:hypothetical protein